MHWGVWATVLLLHLPLFVGIWGGMHLYAKLVLRRRGVAIAGTCTGIRQSDDSWYTSYQYRVAGQGSFSKKTRGYRRLFAASGGEVMVTYDPRKPARSRITDELDAMTAEIGIVTVCAVTQLLMWPIMVMLFGLFDVF
ncbi:DUF3592 domain-containing protein [Streptomyces prunicolor]|jgi:hypothetical protein|uniref:DUF3592 domain-containing protein n=1 Tax=Streptomyces prunicolor TaxID=67348 RepID=UPI00344A8CD4